MCHCMILNVFDISVMKGEYMCNHVFKPLWYVCDDYGITTNRVHLETRYSDNKGHLAYCTKCGQVFVREIAEKMSEE